MPRLEAAESRVINQLVPKEDIEDGNAVLELRAGTGGDQAAFALRLSSYFLIIW